MIGIMTVSTKGQITLPAEIRAKFKISSGDKLFGEETAEGFVIRRPQMSLLDYKGFIKPVSPAGSALQAAQSGLAEHVLGKD